MADDLERRGPEDKNKISLTEPWEVRYWTNRFGVTEAQLRECIRRVGNGTAKVAQCLGKSWP
ncbi:DUF3606 domain-containing protein [Methylorubrum podarium]|jgi:Protein of unknown function (DUF3606)|uniref:DUF3606 domain-containing protein n=1 Tax=Methylorubrum podarium TaxID=200476 RepID=UPI001EE30B6A|nr:DUF3606 domain-containing protein [Methylorubrum podarium]GJE70127.1 hypothetical protein CHKEEEPN_1661 [Methylorubrum podarium]